MREIVHLALRWLQKLTCPWWTRRLPAPELLIPAPAQADFRPLQRVLLSEDVSRTLFAEYEDHRRGSRGNEEIGWVLMGLRQHDEVQVLATLPAGTARSASVVHVRFDSEAQSVGSRAVRQKDKRLTIVGVVHTHPGSLRHPSEGDYQGDRLWVGQLRGGEGVFGIGTADGESNHDGLPAHMDARGRLRFSWYVLGKEDRRYRRLPVHSIPGPDLAWPLHAVWPQIETYAAPLDRLFRQLANVSLESADTPAGPALVLNVKLPDPGARLRVLFAGRKIEYFLDRSDLSPIDSREDNLERAVYLILAELAAMG